MIQQDSGSELTYVHWLHWTEGVEQHSALYDSVVTSNLGD